MSVDKFTVSERVVKLRAACIGTAVKRKFSKTISQAEAVRLAREYDIRTALHQIRQAFEVQNQMMSEAKAFTHAVNEVLLGNNTDKIVEIRASAQDMVTGIEVEAKNFCRSDQELWILGQDISKWQREFSTFVRDLTRLHSMRREQIEELHLAPGVLSEALNELNGVFADAIYRSNTFIK